MIPAGAASRSWATRVDLTTFAAELCAEHGRDGIPAHLVLRGRVAAVGAIRRIVGSRGTMTAHEAALLP